MSGDNYNGFDENGYYAAETAQDLEEIFGCNFMGGNYIDEDTEEEVWP